MKMRFKKISGIGNYSRKPWQTSGLMLLLLVASEAVTAQISPNVRPAAKAQGSNPPPAPGRPASDAKAPAVLLKDVARTTEGGNLVFSISISAPVKHRAFLLTDPSRLVVDFFNAENRVSFREMAIDAGNVKKIRIGQSRRGDQEVVRFVFDLAEGFDKCDIQKSASSVRISFPSADSVKEPVPEVKIPEEGSLAPQPETAVSGESTAGKDQATQASLNAAVQTEAARVTVEENPQPAAPVRASEPGGPAFQPVPVQITAPAATSQVQAEVTATSAPHPPAQAPRAQEARFTGAPLTLDLVDISLVDFFRLMAEEGGINIVMDPEIKGNISMKVVKVPWDQIFEAALVNNSLDKQIEGNLVRIARKTTLQDEAKQKEALKKAELLAADIETRIKRLNYAKANTLIPTLSEQKSVRGTVVFDERTNSLIITDLPASIRKMLELVETLDIPQPQVEIEARIVSATRDFARDIGVQFGFVQGNLERVSVGGPNTFGTIGGTRPSATPTNTYSAGNSRSGRGASEGTATQSAGVSTGTASQNAGNFNVNLPAQKAFGGIGISVGNIFDTFLLDAAITAGENKGLAKLISQPKTVTTNNSPATITQGLRFPVQIIANNTITVQFQNAALTLVATPQITYEGNIVLDLQIENNTPDFSRSVNGIPSIRTSESKTRVLVTDGGTTVIGGILIDNEQTQEDRVPGLASLPVIGNVFRRQSVSHSTQEVLFFITPKIIK